MISHLPDHTSPIKEKNLLKIFYTNSRSVFSKIDWLKILINEFSPSIICVCETWLTDAIPDPAIKIPTYQFIRADYPSDNPSGDLLIYFRDNIKFSIINTDDIPCSKFSEFLCVSVQVSYNKTFILALVYNHPPVTLDIYNNNCIE